MLILRIKQAECALADGRLDEAFELAAAGDVRSHRRGQELAGQVARALAGRGRKHLLADRYAEADSDLGKALRLAGNLPEIAELREALDQLRSDRKREADRAAQVLATAKQRVEQGQYSVGRQLIGEMQGDAAEALRAQVDRDKSLAESLAAEVERAMSGEDWEAALEVLAGAPAGLRPRLREQGRKVARSLAPRIREAMRAGRLDLAEMLLDRLGACGAQAMELEDLKKFMDGCADARAELERGRWEAAEACVRRLACVMPDAAWVGEAGERLKTAREAIGAVVAGPLGLVSQGPSPRPSPRVQGEGERAPMRGEHGRAAHATGAEHGRDARATGKEHGRDARATGEGFILSVDGVGSFLVVKGERVTVGAISSSADCDVKLMADAQLPVVTLVRGEEDYLLNCALPVGVNDRLVTSKVLADGDRMALSPRCRMVFRRPSAASATGILDLSGARLPRADVRRVILMGREIIVGPGAGAHVRCDQLEQNIVLIQRDGQLICQARDGICIDGRNIAGPAAVEIGNRVEVGPVSFVMTKVG